MISAELGLIDEEEPEDVLSGDLSREDVGHTVVYTADWTVGTVIDQMSRGIIDVGPKFQRRDVWKLGRKSKFIESLILQLPVPSIVLAEKKNTKGRFLVLDGRQRLLTLLQYSGHAADSNTNSFALRDLDVLHAELNGIGFAGLDELSEMKDAFENATVRAVVIRDWRKEALLEMIFTRLNTQSEKLNAQELRLAAFPGKFVDFVDEESLNSVGLARLYRRQPGIGDARMRDAEQLLRYFAFRNFFAAYKGPMRPFLNQACLDMNGRWAEEEDTFRKHLEDFEEAVEHGFRIFGDSGFGRRYRDGRFQGHRNGAVEDVLLFVLSRYRKQSDKGDKTVKDVFIELSDDPDFVDSIEATPKHGKNSVHRFALLSNALRAKGLAWAPLPD